MSLEELTLNPKYLKAKKYVGLIGVGVVLAILIVYDLSWLLNAKPYGGFFEPDNYMYYKYALQVVQGVPAINKQLIGLGALPFFEHAGLYLLPAWITLYTGMPLIWAFRVLMVLLIGLNLLFVYELINEFYKAMLIPPTFKYAAIMIAFLFPLSLYQFEPIEWRGNLFITTIALAITLIMYYAYNQKTIQKKLPYIAGAGLLMLLAWFMWSGWYTLVAFYIGLVIFTLIPPILYKPKDIKKIRLILGFIVIAIMLIFFFHSKLAYLIGYEAGHLVGFAGCYNNPLGISEMECLNNSNGLMMVLFSIALMVFGLLSDWSSSMKKKQTNFFLGLLIIVMATLLPLALMYVRMVTLLAPFLAVFMGLGLSMVLSRGSRFVGVFVLIMMLLSFVIFINTYYLTSMSIYNVDNPAFLPAIGNVINAQAGKVNLFTFYSYGDWFEAYSKANVYADTIQGQNATKIEYMNIILLANSSKACNMLKNKTLIIQPNYILISKMFKGFPELQNATNNSILMDPDSLKVCGYYPIYTTANTTLLKLK